MALSSICSLPSTPATPLLPARLRERRSGSGKFQNKPDFESHSPQDIIAKLVSLVRLHVSRLAERSRPLRALKVQA